MVHSHQGNLNFDINKTNMNSEQAEKCISVAKQAIMAHDYQKALRFLDKSLNMSPTAEAQQLKDLCKLNLNGKG